MLSAQSKKTKTPQLNLRYFFSTRKFFLLSMVLSIGAIIIFFTFTFPKIQAIQERRATIETQSEMLRQLEQKLSILQNVNTVDAFSRRDQVDQVLPSYKPLLSLLRGLDEISVENGVVVAGFNVSPGDISASASADTKVKSTTAEAQSVDEITLDITVVGEVPKLNQFLAAVDRLAPLTEVQSMTLGPYTKTDALPTTASGSAVNAAGVFEARLTLGTYFYVGKPEIRTSKDLPEIGSFQSTFFDTLSEFRFPASGSATTLDPTSFVPRESLF